MGRGTTTVDWTNQCERITHLNVRRLTQRPRQNGGREKRQAVRSIITSRAKDQCNTHASR
jgi:hypothetical protein